MLNRQLQIPKGIVLAIAIGLTLWLLFFALFDKICAQDFRFTDYKQDEWLGDDKMIHAFGSYALADALRIIEKDKKKATAYTFMLGLIFEIKDGFVPYEKYGRLGGDGFSAKDMVANAIGIGLNVLANKILEGNHDRHRKDSNGKISTVYRLCSEKLR